VTDLYPRSMDWVEKCSSANGFKVAEVKVSAGLG